MKCWIIRIRGGCGTETGAPERQTSRSAPPVAARPPAGHQRAPAASSTRRNKRWPETALATRELARHPAFVNRDVFPIIADRLMQKQLFDKLGLATAPWQRYWRIKRVAGGVCPP
ncbi:hypothetical protein MJ563_06915 [Klebsiella pneumoniae]|nr:hypothetical protein MJ563_06915 [Klebsiella pneumoniae]